MTTNGKNTKTPAAAPGTDAAERGEIITLTDPQGNEIDFEFLDLIEYSADSYAVLIPTDEDADQVLIFKVENASLEDNTFTPVEDPDLAMAVFELFREKNKEFFDFS